MSKRAKRSVGKDGFRFTPESGEIEFAPKDNKILDPIIHTTQKLIEIRRSYQPFFHNLRMLPVVRLD